MSMRDRLIELLSEEIRETKNLTRAVVKEITEIRKETAEMKKANVIAQQKADAAQKSANAAQQKVDAAWELVVITREDMGRPIWRKWMGT